MLRHAAALFVLCVPSLALAEDTLRVNQAGFVLDASDKPLTQVGAVLEYALWDAPTGGNKVWPSEGLVTCNVDVTGGYYALALGPGGCGPALTSAELPPGAAR